MEFARVKRTLNRIRPKAHKSLREPAQMLKLSEEHVKIGNEGETLLLADDDEDERILVFATAKAAEAVKKGSMFFMEGTFKSCSKQLSQIYTVHVDLGSTKSATNVIPVAHALLPNKSTDSYLRLFSILKGVLPC